jgi:thymidylate synthase
MQTYLDALRLIMETGDDRMDRTGVGTRSLFGLQMRFDLQQGFPAVTTKKLAWKPVVSELLWFLEGSGDERRLAEIQYGKDRSELTDKKTIWTANAQADYWKPKAKFDGDLGEVYGVQWREWTDIVAVPFSEETPAGTDYLGTDFVVEVEFRKRVTDQIADLIEGLNKDPYGRRHILSAWNPGRLHNMALPPCHCLAQFYVSRGRLSCQLYQRSADFFLGIPFNIASYSLMTHMVAQVCGLGVGDFVHTVGDAHIYINHVDAVTEQLAREPKSLPTLWINPEVRDIDGFTMEDFRLEDYESWPTIKAPMAV